MPRTRLLIPALGLAIFAPAASSATFPAAADCFIRSGSPDTNLDGTALEVSARGSSYNRKIYLSFDISSALPAGRHCTGALLDLAFADSPLIGSAAGYVTLDLYAITDNQDDWRESTLTWNNAPKNTTGATFAAAGTVHLASVTVDSAALDPSAHITFDSPELAAFIDWATGLAGDHYATGAASDADHRVTFLVTTSGTTSDPGFRFASRETATIGRAPALVVDTAAIPADDRTLENENYRVSLQSDLGVLVTELATGAQSLFTPDFEVVCQSSSPGYSLAPITGAAQGGTSTDVNFTVPAWSANPDFAAAPGTRTLLTATGATFDGDAVVWTFAPAGDFTLSARLTLPDHLEPRLAWTLVPGARKYYTVGYIGAPAFTPSSVADFYTPGIWSGLRFPDHAYLVDESRCPLPLAIVRRGTTVTGVVADPAEVPFRLASTSNSRFGIGIRSADGTCRPQLYAPLYGTTASSLATPFTFQLRLLVRAGSLFEATRRVAEGLYGFTDVRRNLPGGSLDTALDNLTDFILNTSGHNYSYWSDNAKANDYVNDQPGYARFQSAACALGLAEIRDDSALYEQRARPSIEYFASRHRNLFKIDGYDPDYPMGGPMLGTYVGDWIALATLTGRRTAAFELLGAEALNSSVPLENKVDATANYDRGDTLDLAKRWLRALIDYYHVTGEDRYRQDAIALADRYLAWRIDQPPIDFRDVQSSFWAEFTPLWDALFELYDITGYDRYRLAAIAGIQEFVMRMNFSPAIPAADITVDGETVPAWRVSEVGLVSEAAGTSSSHRGIFMPYIAATLARATRVTGDPFYATVARANIIGRFLNYAGYGYRGNYSIVYQRANYPLQPYDTYSNTAHMNHPLPLACMIVDYLIADAEQRSAGAVWFPSILSDTGAYFKIRVYGHAPGRFYGDESVWPWLPRGLVSFSGPGSGQLNYIAGHGARRLYLTLSNQSTAPVSATLKFDPARVDWTAGARVRVWHDNVPGPDATLAADGSLAVDVSAGGFTALAIDDTSPLLDLQADYLGGFGPRLTNASYSNGTAAFGRNVGFIVSLSPRRQHAYVYTDAPPTVLSSASLHYSIDGAPETTATKTVYPFEFSIDLPPDASSFTYTIEGSNGQISSPVTLRLAQSAAMPGPPSDLTADGAGESAIRLDWTPPAGADGYRLERLGAGPPGYVLLPNLAPGNTAAFTDSGIQPSVTYAYRIRAFDAAGDSPWVSVIARGDTPVEAWRRDHFATRADTGLSADAADPDGDGLPNLLEYAFATDPLVPSPAPSLSGSSLLLPTVAGRSDTAVSVLVSDDLVHWSEAAHAAPGAAFLLTVPDFDLKSISGFLEITPTSPPARLFYRLSATLVQP